MSKFNTIHHDLKYLIESIYDRFNFSYSDIKSEVESVEYAASTFKLKGLHVKFRCAKITPTKIGQFVTIWRRNEKGITQPHTMEDAVDFFVILTRKDNRVGHFIFPKSVLATHGIITTSTKEGKRGIRVYPPWDITENKQAQKTQKWQINYFVETTDLDPPDIQKLKLLYHLD